MKILVTGGAGFIGSHLVKYLTETGNDVTVLDSLYNENSLAKFTIPNRYKFVRDSVLNTKVVHRLIDDSDVVYHLAAISRVMTSVEHPELTFRVNVLSTEYIARMCAKLGKKLIFSSSREVYGTPKKIPVKENSPLNPENPYGASKAAAESIIVAYSKTYSLDFSILRLSNVVGVGDFQRVIPLFIDRLKNNKNVNIFGRDKVLDFIDIDTVKRIFYKAIEIKNGIYNISSGTGTHLTELANELKKAIESKSRIEVKDNRINEVSKFVGDKSKIEKEIDEQINVDIYRYIKERML